MGRPAYDPRVLLSAWLYGFMIRIRSSRKLEGACRDQIHFLCLTGFQRPDHNTLWRFYQSHRSRMRVLLKPESTEGGRRVSVLKRQEGAPVLLG